MTQPEERIIWRGAPSQAIHFGTYVLCFLFCWLVVPVFIAWWKWLVTRNTIYEVTTQRLRFRTGVFSKKLEEIELYRVRDSTLDEPFFLRLFKAGNIVVQTTDTTTPTVILRAVRGAAQVREGLRQSVEEVRQAKGVRAIEYDAHGAGDVPPPGQA